MQGTVLFPLYQPTPLRNQLAIADVPLPPPTNAVVVLSPDVAFTLEVLT
jgi:hypothetical protein